MHNTARQQPRPDSPRETALGASELRRKGWEVLSDLGLSDEEIAVYYGERVVATPRPEPVSLQ